VNVTFEREFINFADNYKAVMFIAAAFFRQRLDSKPFIVTFLDHFKMTNKTHTLTNYDLRSSTQ